MHCSWVPESPSPAILPGPAHGSRLGLSLGKAFPKQHPKAWWARGVEIRMLTCPCQQQEGGCLSCWGDGMREEAGRVLGRLKTPEQSLTSAQHVPGGLKGEGP